MAERVWRINIVDDSPDDRLEAKVALREDPTRRYCFAEAETGREGLHQLAGSPADLPDCLLLDFSLPDMNGAEFLSAMPRREGQVAVPVVVLTGFAAPEASRAVLKAGAQEFVGKDWLTSVSLARAVESAVERHGMARALWRHARELDQQREWLRVTLHGIGDGVVATDIMGRIMFMNPVAEQLMGYCANEAAGRLLSEVFHIVHEATGQAVENPIAQVLQGGQLVKLAEDTLLIRRDGLELAIADSGAPIRDAAGVLIGVVLIFRDITQQKRSERAARQREALLQAILQNTTTLISAYDLEGRFVHVNRRFEEVSGKSAAEVCGRRPRELFPMEQAAVREANNQRVLAQGKALEREETIMQSDGAHIYSCVTAPLLDAASCAIGVVGVSTDISEYKRVEAALREASHRKDEFLAMLAHELRNPLAPIRNAVHLLKHLGPPTPELIRLREVIDRQVTHLSHLVDDLLDVNRIARGTIHLHLEAVDLAEVLVTAVESCEPQLASRHHKLEICRPPGPLWVEGDPTRLCQIILNLLTNSVKYTPAGGRIQVILEATADQALIRVRDDGVGISAELLPQVFDLFVQAPQNLDRTEGGLGIGLSLVRDLTTMHKGSVEAFSEGLGKGSEFIVRLPLLKPSKVPAPAPAPVPVPSGNGYLRSTTPH